MVNIKKKIPLLIGIVFMVLQIFSIPRDTVVTEAANNAGSQAIGQICLFPYNFVPYGWAKCNGTLLSISEYPALYSKIGTTFGGNGSSTFCLPDLSDKNPLTRTDYYMAIEGEYNLDSVETILGEVCLLPDNIVASDSHTWKLCNGDSLSVSSNNALYSLIGNTYGGNSVTFQIPDLSTKSPLNGMNYYIAIEGYYPQPGVDNPIDELCGGIDLYAFSFIPGDSVSCNGQTLQIRNNTALFSLIGSTFGGDSVSTFKVPNLLTSLPSLKMRYCIKTEGIFPSR